MNIIVHLNLFFAVLIITTPYGCSTAAMDEALTNTDKHEADKHEVTVDSQNKEDAFQSYVKVSSYYAGPGTRAQGEKGEPGMKGEQGPQGPPGGGAVYTRWGRTVCPNTTGTELVYKGLAAGTYYKSQGGGANYLCITEDPKYLSHIVPKYGANDFALSELYASEYQLPEFSSLHQNNVPCAVCHTSQRTSKLMIPGTTLCPQSWTEEYEGYLMSERSNHDHHQHPTVYECVDKDGETVPGEERNTNGALFQLVGAVCNVGLPCPPFFAHRPITCVICTK